MAGSAEKGRLKNAFDLKFENSTSSVLANEAKPYSSDGTGGVRPMRTSLCLRLDARPYAEQS